MALVQEGTDRKHIRHFAMSFRKGKLNKGRNAIEGGLMDLMCGNIGLQFSRSKEKVCMAELLRIVRKKKIKALTNSNKCFRMEQTERLFLEEKEITYGKR